EQETILIKDLTVESARQLISNARKTPPTEDSAGTLVSPSQGPTTRATQDAGALEAVSRSSGRKSTQVASQVRGTGTAAKKSEDVQE
ncbi:unnamed protein product, partial [Amoebophrya sp. A25]